MAGRARGRCYNVGLALAPVDPPGERRPRSQTARPGPLTHSIGEQEYGLRRARLKEILHQEGFDGFLVSALVNIRYLTGFTGSSALLYLDLDADADVLLTDPRYAIQAREQAGCQVRIQRGSPMSGLRRMLALRRVRSLAFESARIPYSTFLALEKAAPGGVFLAPTMGLVERLRAVKSPAEIGSIRIAADTCCAAFAESLRQIRPGILEWELAAELDHRMRRLGAERPAFDTIVAFGPRSALPHAQPSGRALRANELLLIDMGAMQAGYASDMTRVVWRGRPSQRARRLHGAVLEAQLAALDSVRAGRPAGAVDAAARRVLRRHRLDDRFIHSTGHALGLEIHEAPRLGRGDKTRLEAGMVVTVEPGVYIENFGGIRIEDTVVVTNSGCEILTPASKEMLVL